MGEVKKDGNETVAKRERKDFNTRMRECMVCKRDFIGKENKKDDKKEDKKEDKQENK